MRRHQRDDGWLLSFVYDLQNDSSTLVILDAGNMGGQPAATIALPARVPLGFHGNWIADEELLMRNPRWPMLLLFAVTLLAGAMLGAALRAGLRTVPLHAADPFLVTTALWRGDAA